ncbi:MAG: AMP-binding protein, partial [Gammaproteobacteria bacterium]
MSSVDLSDPANRRLGSLLRLHAARNPERPFLLTETQAIRYAAANARTNGFAAGLRGLGIGRGERVAILMDSSIDYVLLALALNKLGAVWVPLNTDYRGEWLAQAIEDSRASALLVDAPYLPRLQALEPAPAHGLLIVRGLDAAEAVKAGARARL